jgi:hypothetical protein
VTKAVMHMSHRLTMTALVTQKSQNSTFFMVKWQKKDDFSCVFQKFFIPLQPKKMIIANATNL